jgi:hypothetical protein
MKLLYDTQTQKLLPWPRIDDEPVVGLAPHLLEMAVVQEDRPAYDPATQRLEKTEVIDTQAQTVTQGWNLVEVPAPTYTASEWVNMGFQDQRPTTLLYLKLQLDAAGKTSPKLAAVQAWLDGMIVAGVTAPEEKRTAEAWGSSPWTFEQASAEALAALTSEQ